MKAGLNVLAPVSERYQKAVDYRCYRLIHKSQRHDDDVASEIQKMHRKVAVQVKEQAFNSKESISVKNFSTKFRLACDSSRCYEDAAVWHFREFMNGPALPAIKVWLTLS